jgi:RHS repeat-associated protein
MSWNYRHDARGQVTSGDKKFLTGGEFAAGLQTEYAYDMAGNRTSKGQGGSAGAVEGTGVRPTTYAAANALNQYSSITHPSSGGTTWIDVAGQRSSSLETIKVNATVAAYQQDPVNGLSFRREVTVSPNTHNTLTVTSTIGGATTTLDTGYVFVPLTAETLTYDADGNLRSDGRWLYTWDAENRLKTLSKQNPASAPNYTWTYTFLYDGLSRRIGTKIDWYFTPGLSYYFTEYDAFVFDDWNLVMSGKNSSGSISSGTRLSYVWGPDIGSNPSGHGSWQKAGGVGGLVAVLSPTDTNRMLPLMDRLGNVTGYRKAVSGTPATLSAVFEYDAFGREVRSSGPVSDAMRFRFSTKYHHGGPYTETDAGLVYYGYRFYDPDRGRWVNRDPIGEKGGRNLYGMVKNSPPNFIDVLGRDISSPDIRDFMEPNPTEGGPHNGYEPSGYPPGKGASDYLPSEQNPWPPLPPCSKRDCNRDCLLVAAALSYANAEGAAKNPAYRPFAPRVQCAIAVGAAACLYSCSFCENP